MVNGIANAFNAFVAYAIDFVRDAFSTLIAQPMQALYDSIESWAMGLISLINSAALNIQGGASNASASQSIFQYIVDSDIFKLLIAIGLSLLAVITVASFLGPCGFLASMVASFLVELLISGMTAAAFVMVGAIVTDRAQSMMLDLVGFGLAAYGVYEVFFKNKSPLQKLSPTAKSIMKGITAMKAGISAFELTTTVASHE